MKPEDYESFCTVVLGFAELKGRPLSAAAIELYWRTMQSWTIEDFRSAAEVLLRRCEWMPTPKDFEDLRRAVSQQDGVEAWERARTAARGVIALGRMRADVTSGDALIDRAVAAVGGYEAIALCESAWRPALERRFLEAYADAREITEARAALPHLAPLAPGGPSASTALPARDGKSATLPSRTTVRSAQGPQRITASGVARTISGRDGGRPHESDRDRDRRGETGRSARPGVVRGRNGRTSQ